MAHAFATFKERKYECRECGTQGKRLLWSYDPAPPCEVCSGPTQYQSDIFGESAAVIGDEIDVTIRDGVCHEDGTPRRFRSRTELRDAERASGWRRLERGERFRNSEPRAPRPRFVTARMPNN